MTYAMWYVRGVMAKHLATSIFLALLVACGSEAGSTVTDGGPNDHDAATMDAPGPDAIEKSTGCASVCDTPQPAGTICFGAELTNAFGRLDGTILAAVGPTDTTCALPNSDHLVIQVLHNGAAYRMVVNVLSDGRNGTDKRVRFLKKQAKLPVPAWSPGWHPGATLDYVADLSVHTADFEFVEMTPLVQRIEDELRIGAEISVYATSDNRPNAAHLVHRNLTNADGAIVINPTSDTPTFLLFHFDGQVF